MRRIKPVSAVPGPSSMKRVKPSSIRYRIDASQRPGEVTCSTSRLRISPAVACGCAVTLEITGTPESLAGNFELPGRKKEQPEDKKARKKNKKKKSAEKPAEDVTDKSRLAHLGLRDARFSCVFSATSFGREGIAQLSAVLQQEKDGGTTLLGDVTWPDGKRSSLRGVRVAKKEPEEKKPAPKDPKGK